MTDVIQDSVHKEIVCVPLILTTWDTLHVQDLLNVGIIVFERQPYEFARNLFLWTRIAKTWAIVLLTFSASYFLAVYFIFFVDHFGYSFIESFGYQSDTLYDILVLRIGRIIEVEDLYQPE